MASTSQSAPEGKHFAKEDKDVIKILLTIIESSKLASMKISENVNTLNLLELYNKYLEIINEHFVHTNKKYFEVFLVRGKKLREDLMKSCKQQNTGRVCIFDSIVIRMLDAEDVKEDELTFPRFSACIAYNYYENVVSNLENLDEMITPSLITGCSKLPMDTDDKDNLKYNKLFCLAVTGVHFIPKMMKNAGKSDDLIEGVFTICLLIDYTQYKKKHIDDNVDFKTFLKRVRYKEDRNTFINAVRNYGIVEFVELVVKESSFKILQLFMRHGCTIELKGKYARKPRVCLRDLTGPSREMVLITLKQIEEHSRKRDLYNSYY